MKLLISQKNQLYKIIEASEFLTPSQFSLVEPKNESDGNPIIKLKNSDYYFLILESKDYPTSYYVNYVPGANAYRDISQSTDWLGIIYHFENWINNVSKELSEPNYWEKLEHEISLIDISYQINNSKFTAREYENLKGKVEGISIRLESIPLLKAQQTEIITELKRVTELAKDLGKFDWINLLVGTMISITIQLGLTRENSALLWALIKEAFNTFFLN